MKYRIAIASFFVVTMSYAMEQKVNSPELGFGLCMSGLALPDGKKTYKNESQELISFLAACHKVFGDVKQTGQGLEIDVTLIKRWAREHAMRQGVGTTPVLKKRWYNDIYEYMKNRGIDVHNPYVKNTSLVLAGGIAALGMQRVVNFFFR